MNPSTHANKLHCRRREITLERKKAAEERRHFEEEKAKVKPTSHVSMDCPDFDTDGSKKSSKIASESRPK